MIQLACQIEFPPGFSEPALVGQDQHQFTVQIGVTGLDRKSQPDRGLTDLGEFSAEPFDVQFLQRT